MLFSIISSGRSRSKSLRIAAANLDGPKILLLSVAVVCKFRCKKCHNNLLICMSSLYGCNVCGEGGEYESLTLDCPLFKVINAMSFY